MIILFAHGFLPAVIRKRNFIQRGSVLIHRSIESLITSAVFKRFYKTCRCKAVPYSEYDTNMYTWHSFVSHSAAKYDVNNMYPTALVQLVRSGICKCDIEPVLKMLAFRQLYGDRYVVVLNNTYSNYSVFHKYGERLCKRRDAEEYVLSEPVDKKTALEVLSGLKCPGAVIRVKDLAKYTTLMAIGRLKHYSAAAWHAVTGYAHSKFLSAVRRFKAHSGDCVAGIYVDTAFVDCAEREFPEYVREAGFNVKLDGADNSAVHILSVNYKVSDVIGAWLIGMIDAGSQAAAVERDCEEYPSVCTLYYNKYIEINSYPQVLVAEMWYRYIARHTRLVRFRRTAKDRATIELTEGFYGTNVAWGADFFKAVLKEVQSSGVLKSLRSSS